MLSSDDDSDHHTSSASQLIQVSIPPMDRRLVLVKLPMSFSINDTLDYVANRFCVSADQCMLVESLPMTRVVHPDQAVHQVPTRSASAFKTIFISWAHHPADYQHWYVHRPMKVGEFVTSLQAYWNVPILELIYLDETSVPADAVISLLPTDHFHLRQPTSTFSSQPIQVHPYPTRPLRGGMRNATAPETLQRQTMITWAEKKVAELIPSLDNRVVRTILRAEYRTTSSILNSRSKQQVQHVMLAALRRTGLTTQANQLEEEIRAQHPQHASQSSHSQDIPPAQAWQASPPGVTQEHQPSHSSHHQQRPSREPQDLQHQPPTVDALINNLGMLIEQLNTQTTILQHLQQQRSGVPDAEINQMVSNFHQQQSAQAHAIAQLTTALSRMDQRVQRWETTYLASIMDRFAELMPPPPTPTSDHEQEHEQQPSSAPLEHAPTTQTGGQGQAQPSTEGQAEAANDAPLQSQPTLLDRAENRSLQACCARVIATPKPKALRPFQAP